MSNIIADLDEYANASGMASRRVMLNAKSEIERLRAALEMIAGRRQPLDNTLSNVLIARDALDLKR
jgi:hypothetical protein